MVDDEPQITRVLRTTLSAQGYDIRVANDGEMALELMKNWTPHVVVTDLAMPNLDGVELCRQGAEDVASANYRALGARTGSFESGSSGCGRR